MSRSTRIHRALSFALLAAAPLGVVLAHAPAPSPLAHACGLSDTVAPSKPPEDIHRAKPHNKPLAGGTGVGTTCNGNPGSPFPPAPAGGSPLATTPGGLGGGTLLSEWEAWWHLWEDDHLSAPRPGAIAETSGDDFFLGRGAEAARRSRAVDRAEVESAVLPALYRALEDPDPRVRSASLIAIARAAREVDRDGTARKEIEGQLGHRNESVSAAAALALGILGQTSSAPKLVALVQNEPFGQELAGRTTVPDRVRACAAYGLGELAGRSGRRVVQRTVATVLLGVLDTERSFAQPDVPIAAVIALGSLTWDERDRAHGAATVARLLHAFGSGASGPDTASDPRVRSQLPLAIARALARDTDTRGTAVGRGALRGEAIAAFASALDPKNGRVPDEVRRGAVLALGTLADASDDLGNRVALAALERTSRKSAHPLTRHLALISLARLGARGRAAVGPARFALAGEVEARLLDAFRSERGEGQAWAALALGSFVHRTREHAGYASPRAVLALREAFPRERTESIAGALAVGLGLMRDVGAEEVLARRIEAGGGHRVVARCGVALGLMGARRQGELLRVAADGARFQPLLFRGLAHGALLAGVGSSEDIEDAFAELGATTRSVPMQGAVCAVLGVGGSERAVSSLLGLLAESPGRSSLERERAALALGRLCESSVNPGDRWDHALRLHAQQDRTTRLLGGAYAGPTGNPKGWDLLRWGGGLMAM